ncbi:MAG: ligand-binding sensor domain-containing protein, partial [Wenzhouxiangellaceae bacterium]
DRAPASLDHGDLETANIVFRPLGRSQGLDARTVSAIEVDAKGFLWVGSREGVYRYDGVGSLRFQRESGNPEAISDTDIRTMYLDPRGRLWISTNTGGLNLYRPGAGFRSWRNDPGDLNSLSYDSVYGVAMTPDGALWIGTQKGLNRLDPTTGNMRRVVLDDSPGGDPTPYIYPVAVDPNGDLWIGTVGSGLYRRPHGGRRFEHIDLGEAVGDRRVNDVFALHWMDGYGMFVGTRGGLVRMHADHQGVIAARVTPIPQNIVTAIAADGSQRLLIATLSAGLLELEPNTGRVRRVRSGNDTGALPDRPVISLEVHDGQIFVGTLGSGAFVGSRQRQEDYTHMLDGLRNTNIMAIVPGDEAGEVFVGTFGGGVQRVHVSDGGAREVVFDPDSPARTFGVTSMVRGRDGELYAGTTDGLWRIQPESGQTRKFTPELDGLGEGYVTTLLPIADGNLLIGTGGSGVFRFDPTSQSIESMSNGGLLPDVDGADYVTTLLAEGVDAVWAGTRSSGLFLCSLRPWSCRPVASEESLGHHNVTALYRDRHDVVWIASDGGGLRKVLGGDTESGFRLEQPATTRGIFGDHIMAMAEDADGSMWLTSRGGLVRLDPRSGDTMRPGFQLPEGAKVFHADSIAMDSEYLYFGSVDGLVAVKRGTVFDPAPVRPLRFTRINAPTMESGQRLDV